MLARRLLEILEKFWKNVASLFSNQIKSKERTTPILNDNIISNDKKVAETFHEFFTNVAETLNISKNSYTIFGTCQTDPVLQSTVKVSEHPSIINIKNRMSNSNCTFPFKSETKEKFSKLIQNLNYDKATRQCDIPIKIL